MKVAIFWAVVRSWYISTHGFDIMKVTSIDNKLAYGSYKHGMTRIRLCDIKGKFDNEEKATIALNKIKQIYKDFEQPLKDANKQIRNLEQKRQERIDVEVLS